MTEETRVATYRLYTLEALYSKAREMTETIINADSSPQDIAIAQHHRGTIERIIKTRHYTAKHMGPVPADHQGSQP